MKVHHYNMARAMVELRPDRVSETAVERISHALLKSAEVRRVSHRDSGGLGGVFVNLCYGMPVTGHAT